MERRGTISKVRRIALCQTLKVSDCGKMVFSKKRIPGY